LIKESLTKDVQIDKSLVDSYISDIPEINPQLMNPSDL
jgi:hypothetical protein